MPKLEMIGLLDIKGQDSIQNTDACRRFLWNIGSR